MSNSWNLKSIWKHDICTIIHNKGCEGDLLRHLSPHWSPGLICWSGCLGGCPLLPHPSMCVPPFTVCWVRGHPYPQRRGLVFHQGYMSSWASLIEPPKKLSSSLYSCFLRKSRVEGWNNMQISDTPHYVLFNMHIHTEHTGINRHTHG